MRSIKEIKEQLTQATAQLATLESVASRLDVFEDAERAVVEASLAGSKHDAERLVAKLQEEMVDGQSATLLEPLGIGLTEVLVKLTTDYPALRDSHGIQAAAYFKTPEDTEPTIVLSFRNRVSRVTRAGGGGRGQPQETEWGTFNPGQGCVIDNGPNHVGESFRSIGAAYSACHAPRGNGLPATAGIPSAIAWFKSAGYALRPNGS